MEACAFRPGDLGFGWSKRGFRGRPTNKQERRNSLVAIRRLTTNLCRAPVYRAAGRANRLPLASKKSALDTRGGRWGQALSPAPSAHPLIATLDPNITTGPVRPAPVGPATAIVAPVAGAAPTDAPAVALAATPTVMISTPTFMPTAAPPVMPRRRVGRGGGHRAADGKSRCSGQHRFLEHRNVPMGLNRAARDMPPAGDRRPTGSIMSCLG